ncbi:C4-dicarboxylate transport protein [compost metagenome]
MFHIPEAGLLLIIGIDQFFDMGRTATNVVGNSIATAVVAKFENEVEPADAMPEPDLVSEKQRLAHEPHIGVRTV